MSVLFKKLINPIIAKDAEEEERSKIESKRYLILIYTEDGENEIKTFRTAIGRTNAIEEIYELYEEYGYINWFKSVIISDSVTIENAISLYSFFRYVFENDRDEFILSIVSSVEDLNDFVLETNESEDDFQLISDELHIDSLDEFYNKDMNHLI